MVDALSLIHPTDKWYIYNFHIPKYISGFFLIIAISSTGTGLTPAPVLR
jgi:hypothetical protein